jgi:hypothetical protein
MPIVDILTLFDEFEHTPNTPTPVPIQGSKDMTYVVIKEEFIHGT